MNTKKLQELRAQHAEMFHAQIGRTDASDGFMRLIDAILEPEPAPETVVGEHLDLIVDAYAKFRRALVEAGVDPNGWPATYHALSASGKAAIDAFALRLIERVRSERRASPVSDTDLIEGGYRAWLEASGHKGSSIYPQTVASIRSDTDRRAFSAFAMAVARLLSGHK